MTIYEIKRRTAKTAPYFFTRDTLRFFGQTMKSFAVKKQADGRFKISAPWGRNWEQKLKTVRFFNPINNKLELEME